MVAKVVLEMSSNILSLGTGESNIDEHLLRLACAKCLCTMLGAIPDEVCDSISKWRMSMDPRIHAMAMSELRSHEKGLSAFIKCIKESLPALTGRADLHTDLHTCLLFALEKWARVVPITESFLNDFLPLVLVHIENGANDCDNDMESQAA